MIRDATAEDLMQIRSLMQSVPGFWDASWRPDVLERVVASPGTIAVVHAKGTAIDGFACAHDLGFRAYLSELIVASDSRRQGVGSTLLSEVERRMADRGCSLIVGDVWRDAERFYRAQGWTPPSVVLLRKRLDARRPGV